MLQQIDPLFLSCLYPKTLRALLAIICYNQGVKIQILKYYLLLIMGRKKKEKEVVVDTPPLIGFGGGSLKEETKHGIFGVLFIALGIFFILAKFEYAGMAGGYTYKGLTFLFGSGYLLLPIILIIVGVSFFLAIKPNFLLHRIIGGLLLFVSALGILNIVLDDVTAGGLVGKGISTPLITLFDFYVSLVVLISASLIAIFIIFDSRLTFDNSFFGLRFGKQKDDLNLNPANTLEEKDLIIKNGTFENLEVEEGPGNLKQKAELERKTTQDNAVADGGLLAGVMSFTRRSGNSKQFIPPPISLLSRDSGKPGVGDIKANSNIIKRTLSNFGIHVEMDEISIGPSITRYALKPAEGVKLSRILNLQNDLSLALAAHPIRIEAPIPGRSLVGIEIPNTTKTTVGLGSILSSKEFTSSQTPLLIGLGRGISGDSHFANIAKAPHMLIAGTTGSGKSVTIHTLVTSLLYRNPPERLRFLMIDPKRVELTLYNKIPHLLSPVITDPKKAIMALRWATKEMERRYAILEEETVRDIQSYHTNVLEPALKNKAEQEDVELMPYIVIIIDELADIMSTYPRELEAAVVRLAQMSRAVGIHLILSTQRPSVEVITGLIKANIPARIALQVASQIDSRTILDSPGAEKLLGAGDMLYLSGEMSKAIRLQSAFIPEAEVKKVVKHITDEYADVLPDQINLEGSESSSGGNGIFSSSIDGGNDNDELYEDARMAVLEAGKASASYLQRKLKVGYARAARLLDMLEERGVVGPADGAKPRDVYGNKPSENYDA